MKIIVNLIVRHYLIYSKTFNNFSLKSKYSFLTNFFTDLNKFKKLKTIKQKTEMKKCVY